LILGLGTVAAQSQQPTPWWHDVFQTGPIFGHSERGEVTISTDGPLPYFVMSGNLGKAKQLFPTTGEYIGCQIFSDPNDGQFITCAARDAEGGTLECTSIYVQSTFLLREHMLLNAAVNLTDSHYVVVNVDPLTQECLSVQVMASSADFLADGGPSTPGDCNELNAVDLGGFGGPPVSVPTDACVSVSQFAQPDWSYGPNRTMQLQNSAGSGYPVTYEYVQSCTGASGSGQFDGNFDDQYLPGLSDACPLFIKLLGDGNASLSLRYW
jgi:hypothetical protein